MFASFTSESVYFLAVLLLFVLNGISWVAIVFGLPGNWLMVLFTAAFAWLFPADAARGVGWNAVGVLATLALVGEIIEFVAGAAGAATRGASRRSVVLSIVGATIGSVVGTVVGIPIPVLGPMIAAVAGGALGAFVGAYAGEQWSGAGGRQRWEAGRGALIGRLLGTTGKLLIGSIMLVIATAASLL